MASSSSATVTCASVQITFATWSRHCSNPKLDWSHVSTAVAQLEGSGRVSQQQPSISTSCRAFSWRCDLDLAQPCFGSTIALRTETLRRIGGFEAFADALADDYAMGEAVRRLGLKVAIPAFTIGHTFSETALSEVIAHELRWARTIRLVDPKGYAGSILTHPLPFAIAALLLSGFSAISFIILATTLACRLFVPIQVERLPGGGKSSVWLSPLRDLMSFVVFIASFMPGAVKWRGRRYRVGSDGSVTPI